MSKFIMSYAVDSDGFRIIKSKRHNKNKPTKIPAKDKLFVKTEIEIDINKAFRRISTAVEDFKQSHYLEDVSKSVSKVLQGRKLVKILCLGLGHIGECAASKYQLALLLSLKDLYEPEKVLVHDPVFYKDECLLLNQLGLEVIEENKEGSYVIHDTELTLVYLPHCPIQLTNNFLWSNWGPTLCNCLLICNSFDTLNDNEPSRFLRIKAPYIQQIYPYIKEIALENNFKYNDIFNNTSLHYFPKENLDRVEANFWMKAEKTQYEDSDEIITSLMVEKLKF